MGCVKSKKQRRQHTEKLCDSGRGKGVIRFKEEIESFELPVLNLDVDLCLTSKDNYHPMTPSFRRLKSERVLIKRHSAPEGNRGAFPALNINIVNKINIFQYPETTRQQQLSELLNNIDNMLDQEEITIEIKTLLRSLRNSLFELKVDVVVAKSLYKSIKTCNISQPQRLCIGLYQSENIFQTQCLPNQSEIKALCNLISSVPHRLQSLRVSQFQLNSLQLKQIATIISQCKNLNQITLEGCSVDNDFIQCLTTNLLRKNSLEELDLQNNFIRDSGLIALGNFLLNSKCNLKKLNISNNFITPEALQNFGQTLLASQSYQMHFVNVCQPLEEKQKQIMHEIYFQQLEMKEAIVNLDLALEKSVRTHFDFILAALEQNLNIKLKDTNPSKESNAATEPNQGRVIESSQSVRNMSLAQKTKLDNVGFHFCQGSRAAMEDYIAIHETFRNKVDEKLYGIFDGHGGHDTARVSSHVLVKFFIRELSRLENLVSKTEDTEITKCNQLPGDEDQPDIVKKALHLAFSLTQQFLTNNKIQHGSCALIVYIRGTKIYTANAGDSQAIIISKDLHENVSFKELGVIKKPTDKEEKDRIEKYHGIVLRNRVDGTIAVSRALGDVEFQPKISYEPIIVDTTVSNSNWFFVVIASDGLWNKVSYESVATLVVQEKRSNQLKRSSSASMKQAYSPFTTDTNFCWNVAKELCALAKSKGPSDNVSVICSQIN